MPSQKASQKKEVFKCVCVRVYVFVLSQSSLLTPISSMYFWKYIYKHMCPQNFPPNQGPDPRKRKKKTLRRNTRWLRLWLTHGPILLTFPIKDVDRGPWMETPLRWVAWGVGGKNRSCFIIFLLCGGMLNIAADLAYSVWNSYFTLHTFKNPQKNI